MYQTSFGLARKCNLELRLWKVDDKGLSAHSIVVSLTNGAPKVPQLWWSSLEVPYSSIQFTPLLYPHLSVLETLLLGRAEKVLWEQRGRCKSMLALALSTNCLGMNSRGSLAVETDKKCVDDETAQVPVPKVERILPFLTHCCLVRWQHFAATALQQVGRWISAMSQVRVPPVGLCTQDATWPGSGCVSSPRALGHNMAQHSNDVMEWLVSSHRQLIFIVLLLTGLTVWSLASTL